MTHFFGSYQWGSLMRRLGAPSHAEPACQAGHGFGFGAGLAGSALAGYAGFGGALSGDAEAGVFLGHGGVRLGGFAGGGAMAGGPPYSLSVGGARPLGTNGVWGGGGGIGVQAFVTNASGASDLQGMFDTYSISVGPLSFTLDLGDNGVVVVSGSIGKTWGGAGFTHFQTYSATVGGNGCP